MTVAVFEEKPEAEWALAEKDIQTWTTKDTGPGGQHRNKVESCVVMRHLPTGIEAKAASKSQHANRRTAREMLEARVSAHYAEQARLHHAADRKSQVGCGARADKIRTYREQDDLVTDHRSGTKARLSQVRAGNLARLW